jgi:hypothetical protein
VFAIDDGDVDDRAHGATTREKTEDGARVRR